MFKQGIIVTLSIAFVTLLIISLEKEIRKIYMWEVDYYWNIDIINEKNAHENTSRSETWESWELALVAITAWVVIGTVGWSMFTVLQAHGENRTENNKDETNVFEKVSERVTKVEQSMAELINNMSKLTESLDRMVSTPVETIFERTLETENGNYSLLTNDDSVYSPNNLKAEIQDPETEVENIEDTSERNDFTNSAESSPKRTRPESLNTDPKNWYQDIEESTSYTASIVEDLDTDKGAGKNTEVTVSEPLPVPMGCGEAARGQSKRIPQYSRRNLQSRGKECTTSDNNNSPTPVRRKQRGYSQKY